MRIKQKALDPNEIFTIVDRVSNGMYGGNIIVKHSNRHSPNVITLTIRALYSNRLGARRSYSGRRSISACWHAHRDVIRAILTRYPEATITTGLLGPIRYEGLQHFEATYPDTGSIDIGSMFQPAQIADLCECDGNEPVEYASTKPARPTKPPVPIPTNPFPVGTAVRHKEGYVEGTITDIPAPGVISIEEKDGFRGDWLAEKFDRA